MSTLTGRKLLYKLNTRTHLNTTNIHVKRDEFNT